VIERQGDHVDHKVKLMVIASAKDGAGRGYTMLLVRMTLVADVIDSAASTATSTSGRFVATKSTFGVSSITRT